MTPQEKAIELVDKFKYISYYLDDIQNHKEGALIAVDEIINNVLIGIDLPSTWGDYWIKVKQEIEKL
jgi:hypothetical protein